MRKIIHFSPLLALLWLGFAGPAQAGSYDAGTHLIHYNALPTSQLTPEVASAYNILRSRTRGMLNVAVTRKIPNSTGEPVPAKVRVHAANLNGQVKNISLREVREGEAIYYIGEINISEGETLVFDLYVSPEGGEQTHHIRFQQTFYSG